MSGHTRVLAVCSAEGGRRHAVAKQLDDSVVGLSVYQGGAALPGERTDQFKGGARWWWITQADYDLKTELDAEGVRHANFGGIPARCKTCKRDFHLSIDDLFTVAADPGADPIVGRSV